MEIPKPQFRPPEIVPDQEPQSTQESEAKQPIGLAQNDSIEIVKASPLHDFITGSTDANDGSAPQELSTDFQHVVGAENLGNQLAAQLEGAKPGSHISEGAGHNFQLGREAIMNFLAEHGLDVGSGRGAVSGTGSPGSGGSGGGGVSSSVGGSGGSTPGMNLEDFGGPTGPGDAFASANERYSQAVGRSKEAFERLKAQVFGGLSAADEPAANFGNNGMISTGFHNSVIHHTDGPDTDVNDFVGSLPGDNNFTIIHTEHTDYGWVDSLVIDSRIQHGGDDEQYEESHLEINRLGETEYTRETVTTTDKEGNTYVEEGDRQSTTRSDGSTTDTETNTQTVTDKDGNSISTVTKTKENKDKDGKVTSSSSETTTTTRHKNADGSYTVTVTNPDGTSETHDEPAPGAKDSIPDPDAPGARLSFLPGQDLPRLPRFQGDVDGPEGNPVGISLEDAQPGFGSQLREYGMLVNPDRLLEGGSGSGSGTTLPRDLVTDPPETADSPPTTSGPRENVDVNAQFGAAVEPPAEEDGDTSTTTAQEELAKRLRKFDPNL